jgi:hypothetical protein
MASSRASSGVNGRVREVVEHCGASRTHPVDLARGQRPSSGRLDQNGAILTRDHRFAASVRPAADGRHRRTVACTRKQGKLTSITRKPPSKVERSWQQGNLVERKCRVSEWEAEQVELPDADPDCPWCHGPTEALQVLPLPGGIVVSGVPHAKNPFASALGRLGASKGGVARARALSPKRRREIARNAARARWAKAAKKR